MGNAATQKLKPFFDKIKRLDHLLGVVGFDLLTTAPSEAIEEQSDLFDFYQTELASVSKDPEFIALIKEAKELGGLNDAEELMIDDYLFEIKVMEKVPLEKYAEWSKAVSKCNEMWKKAKNANDWNMVLPYFKKVVEIYRENSELYRLPFHKTRYDAYLSQYEKGQTEEDINRIFEPLKKFLMENLDEVIEKQSKLKMPEIKPHSRDDQARLSTDLLDAINYDLNRGVLRETEHPFSNYIARNDARVTTHYYEEDWRSSMFSVIHEGGHAIQFQNWTDYHYDNHVNGRASCAMDETHSRFYENIIARNRNYVPTLLKLCRKDLGQEFNDMDEESFYNSINQVTHSLIRTDSDEYTYCLHIILRYELERDLINGVIEVEDLPRLWNQKYEEYLGVTPPNDTMGVLQDVHWYQASFGYFPSYALGNIYGAQILHYMKKDLPFDELLRQGNLKPILEWFKEKDFAYDYLNPKDWILKVTGEEMNPRYFVDYIKDKFLN